MKENHNQIEQLIIGAGEVGKALFNVLKKHYNIAIRDIESNLTGKFKVLHICYPFFKSFINSTKKYIKMYKPEIVIIHSTVPVGITRKISKFSVHSPIRGIHPYLESGIKTFTKYFGGFKAKEAAKIFSDIGIKTKIFKNSETTELIKILDTTYYGWNIIFNKEVKKICDKYKLDFNEVYTIPNKDYNEGYKKLGMPYVIRPLF